MTFNFGVLGAAKITPMALLEPVSVEPLVCVRCVAARDPARAEAFAKSHNIAIVHRDYQAVLDDPLVDAVYVPLPISEHAQWALKALAAGKHVLCEKSLASNAAEAIELRDQASACGLVLMEAFIIGTIRCLKPQSRSSRQEKLAWSNTSMRSSR